MSNMYSTEYVLDNQSGGIDFAQRDPTILGKFRQTMGQ